MRVYTSVDRAGGSELGGPSWTGRSGELDETRVSGRTRCAVGKLSGANGDCGQRSAVMVTYEWSEKDDVSSPKAGQDGSMDGSAYASPGNRQWVASSRLRAPEF